MLDVQQIAAAALADQAQREADAKTETAAAVEYQRQVQGWTRLSDRAATLTLPDEEAGEIVLAVAKVLAARQAGEQVARFLDLASVPVRREKQHVAAVLLEAMKPEATAVEIGRLWNSAKSWIRKPLDLQQAAHEAYEALRRPPDPGKPAATVVAQPRPAAGDDRQPAAVPEPVAVPIAPEPVATAAGKGVAPRDEWCLAQYEARGSVTFHKPSKVCAKWNAMKLSERQAICPDRPETAMPYAIDKGIKRARKVRGGKPSKPPAKRKSGRPGKA